MRPMYRIAGLGLIIAMAAFRCAPCAAQTTQPATSWRTLARQFAQQVAAQDAKAVVTMVADPCAFRRFDGSGSDDVPALLAAVANARLVGVHGYTQPPLAMAADLAADFKSTPGLSRSLRAHMIPQDDPAMRRANATAAQWLEEVLGAKEGDSVGVAVFYLPQTNAASTSPVVFVLFKGDAQGRIAMAVFGQPM